MMFNQIHSIACKRSFNLIQIYSTLFEIGSNRVKQMTGQLNDWTHSDLYGLLMEAIGETSEQVEELREIQSDVSLWEI